MQNSQSKGGVAVSYHVLRQMIGWLGIALPFSILFYSYIVSSCGGLETSISEYYHTEMRDILVGILCILGIFMVTNQAFALPDRIASTFAGVCAIGIAMFPTDDHPVTPCGIDNSITPLVGTIHYVATAGLFLAFAYMSIFRFRKSDKSKADRTHQKNVRNNIYLACGLTILGCIAVLFLHRIIAGPSRTGWSMTFWFETITLIAFGTSWIIKGEAFLADKPKPSDEQEAEPAIAIAGG